MAVMKYISRMYVFSLYQVATMTQANVAQQISAEIIIV